MSFNPMALLTASVLQGLVNTGHRYFVRQSFTRGNTAEERGFLLSHYENYFRAKEHLDILVNDGARRLYDWEDAEDRIRLQTAASQPDGFRVFANLFRPDWEKSLNWRLREKIRAYIDQLDWQPGGSESVQPQFYPHFGEVYVSLQYKGREVRVNFEEIENG